MAKSELSEFVASQHMALHVLDNKPSPNIEGAKKVNIKKGDKIPKVFIPTFLRYNRDYIANLAIKDGIPQLTKEQEEEYQVFFNKPVPTTFEQEVEKAYGKYDIEIITEIMNDMGVKKFKEWAEKEFGEEKIDKRKSGQKIIVDILNLQSEG